MALVFELLLLAVALWSAHLAGAQYVLGKSDPALKRSAVARTIFSILAAVAALCIHSIR